MSLFIILGQTGAHLDHEQCVNLIPRKPWGRAVLLGGEGQGVLMLLCENFEKDLDIWWNKIYNLKKDVRTPGNEAET